MKNVAKEVKGVNTKPVEAAKKKATRPAAKPPCRFQETKPNVTRRNPMTRITTLVHPMVQVIDGVFTYTEYGTLPLYGGKGNTPSPVIIKTEA